uniref:Uncharacterized protein n=1 Tax=Globisporangium ultimum (strain ATCC 200006 / CBS 805.95 / DAOM BR144) TaxID=431595 RepID=K3WHC1_GLOUD
MVGLMQHKVPFMRSRRRQRAVVERLRPDDFDDVRYKVEMVRTSIVDAPSDDDDGGGFSRGELLELAFVGSVFLLVLGACVVVGLTGDVVDFSRGALLYLLPILLLPLAWLVALHAWEKHALERPPRAAHQHRRHSAVAASK